MLPSPIGLCFKTCFYLVLFSCWCEAATCILFYMRLSIACSSVFRTSPIDACYHNMYKGPANYAVTLIISVLWPITPLMTWYRVLPTTKSCHGTKCFSLSIRSRSKAKSFPWLQFQIPIHLLMSVHQFSSQAFWSYPPIPHFCMQRIKDLRVYRGRSMRWRYEMVKVCSWM